MTEAVFPDGGNLDRRLCRPADQHRDGQARHGSHRIVGEHAGDGKVTDHDEVRHQTDDGGNVVFPLGLQIADERERKTHENDHREHDPRETDGECRRFRRQIRCDKRDERRREDHAAHGDDAGQQENEVQIGLREGGGFVTSFLHGDAVVNGDERGRDYPAEDEIENSDGQTGRGLVRHGVHGRPVCPGDHDVTHQPHHLGEEDDDAHQHGGFRKTKGFFHYYFIIPPGTGRISDNPFPERSRGSGDPGTVSGVRSGAG